jgi:hypothetical protein
MVTAEMVTRDHFRWRSVAMSRRRPWHGAALRARYSYHNRSPREPPNLCTGGTPKGQIEANVAYWRRTLDFLAEAEARDAFAR